MTQLREDPQDICPGRNRSATAIPKGRLVMIDTDKGTDAVELATGNNLPFKGVSLEAIADGANGDVAQAGRVVVECGGAVTVGAKITGTTGGKGIVTTTNNHHVAGIAQTATSTDGDFFEMEISGKGAQVGA